MPVSQKFQGGRGVRCHFKERTCKISKDLPMKFTKILYLSTFYIHMHIYRHTYMNVCPFTDLLNQKEHIHEARNDVPVSF